MKTLFKFLGLVVGVLVLALVLLNSFPAQLHPGVREFIDAQNEVAKKYNPQEDVLEKLQAENGKKDIDKMPVFIEVMKNFKAEKFPPQIGKMSRLTGFSSLTKEYLQSLNEKSEKEKLQGAEYLVGFLDEMARSRGTFISFMIALVRMRETTEWIKAQKWSASSQPRVAALDAKVQKAIDDRESLIKTAIDADLGLQLSLIQEPNPRESWLALEMGDRPNIFKKSLYKLLSDTNATLNQSYSRAHFVEEKSFCIKNYTCGALKEEDYHIGAFEKLRNPVGYKVLKMLSMKYETILIKTQVLFKNLDKANGHAG